MKRDLTELLLVEYTRDPLVVDKELYHFDKQGGGDLAGTIVLNYIRQNNIVLPVEPHEIPRFAHHYKNILEVPDIDPHIINMILNPIQWVTYHLNLTHDEASLLFDKHSNKGLRKKVIEFIENGGVFGDFTINSKLINISPIIKGYVRVQSKIQIPFLTEVFHYYNNKAKWVYVVPDFNK